VQKETVKKLACQTSCFESTTLNANAQKCVSEKYGALSKVISDGNGCIETALGRPCISTRARRSPAGHLSGRPGGIGPSRITNLSGDAAKEFSAFQKCFFECIHKPAEVPQGGQSRLGPGREQAGVETTTVPGGQGPIQPWKITEPGSPIENTDELWTTTQGPARGGFPGGPGRLGGYQGGPGGSGGHHGGPNMFYAGCDRLPTCSLAPLNPTKNPIEAEKCKNTTIASFIPIETAYCSCLQIAYSANANAVVKCTLPTVQ